MPDAERYRKADITFEQLDEITAKQSDSHPARQRKAAKSKLFQSIFKTNVA